MARTTKLRKMDGEKFGAFAFGTQWETVQRIVAEEFRCRPDDVSIDEGTEDHDEGLEYLVIDGERVGFLDEGRGLPPDYEITIPIYQMAAE